MGGETTVELPGFVGADSLERFRDKTRAFLRAHQDHSADAVQAGHRAAGREKWTFEIKFDGYRRIALKRGREVTFFSRNQRVLNKRFQNVAARMASMRCSWAFTKTNGSSLSRR
jgi:ATP-dependent DNA ligase